MNKNEIQKSESPLMAAAALMQKDGMDVAKLKELLDLQERWQAIEAKKAYVQAMSEFKAIPPEILKDRTVKYGNTSYKHATLHNVTSCINQALSEHGLTASWVTSQDNGDIKVTCKITHIMGHSEKTCLSAPPDATGSKNPIQAIGSTITYLERYTILALTGLATADQDDDGKAGASNQQSAEKPTKKMEQQEIVDQAFFNFTTENEDALAKGFMYSKELFIEAIIKHHGHLPTHKESIEKILASVKPAECTVEVRDDLEEFPQIEDPE